MRKDPGEKIKRMFADRRRLAEDAAAIKTSAEIYVAEQSA